MLSQKHNFIFLHVPRTGGNSIQSYLLPFSEDRKLPTGKQGGSDTFGIVGPITPTKHALLADYAAKTDVGRYRIVMCTRHPLERALSLYFAPIRVLGGLRERNQRFDFDGFARLVNSMRPMVEYLQLNDTFHRPDLVLPYEDGVDRNLLRLTDYLALPRPDTIPHLNRGEAAQRAAIRGDARVLNLVTKRFRADFEFFGYKFPAAN